MFKQIEKFMEGLIVGGCSGGLIAIQISEGKLQATLVGISLMLMYFACLYKNKDDFNPNLYDGYSWIKVGRYKFDKNKSWQERYKALTDHHVQETNFLINVIRTNHKTYGSKNKS